MRQTPPSAAVYLALPFGRDYVIGMSFEVFAAES
jgi:hypothetical protein